MDSGAIRDRLQGHFVDARPDRSLSISSAVIRAEVDGVPLVAVGSDRPVGTQITGLLDAIHYWSVRYEAKGPLRYVVGHRSDEAKMAELLGALGSLRAALVTGIDLSVEVDFEPVDLSAADFGGIGADWLDRLGIRDDALDDLPAIAQQLSSLVDDPMFRWYANVWGTRLSGRLDGLQICTLTSDGTAGTLAIGAAGRDEARVVRERFRAAAGERDSFAFGSDLDKLFEATQIVKRLAADRGSGKLQAVEPEHRLEALILREAVDVRTATGALLENASRLGQFPARFAPGGTAKLVDLIMHDGPTPWVIELKVLAAGAGKYLRHAIAQAVLYRHFVRTASGLHEWFHQRDLQPEDCRAAVAFPRATGAAAERRIAELRTLAAHFDVEVIELDVDQPALPPNPEGDALVAEGATSPDYRVVVRFATEPDDPETIAAEIAGMLGGHELAIVEAGDIEVTLEIFADGVFRAARTAMDRVESAVSESSFGRPELLSVEVEGIFPWLEAADAAADGGASPR